VHARPSFGQSSESAWLRLGAPIEAGRRIEPDDASALTLTDTHVASAAIAAGVQPSPKPASEDQLLSAVLSGICSDLAPRRTGFVFDMLNALAPREFIHLAKPEDMPVFAHVSAHCDSLMPTLKRQEAFRRLKRICPAFESIQRTMNKVRRSPNTIAPWSDVAELLRREYGPSWFAADIAVIGAAISPTIRRDLGPMDPGRSPFGAEIDYGRLANDIRIQRKSLDWWLAQREAITTSDRALWAYALLAVAVPSVVEACLTALGEDLGALDSDVLTALTASSSRLGLSGISRRLPPDLLIAACNVTADVGLLVAHHVDVVGAGIPLATALTTRGAIEAARFGAAGWPALYAAGAELVATHIKDWLGVLKAHGPTARSATVSGDLSDELCGIILDDSASYPLQWVVAAENCRSATNVERPLLQMTAGWFEE
jgi:hypothetical protein